MALVLLPLLFNGQFILFMATQALVMMLVAIGLNLLTGYAGQVSIGHGALVGLGAYTTALLMKDLQWSFWLSALAGIFVACGTGLIMALPALRLSTWYFALVTLTFAQVVTDLLVEWRSLTHGFSGVVGIPAPSLNGHILSPVQVYLTLVVCVVLVFLATRQLVNSRFGRGMVAARDNPLAASASGVSLWRIKLLAFAMSAGIAGLAGAFYAVQKTVITPEDFSTDFSIFFLLCIVVGGQGKLLGPVVGTLAFFLLPELLGPLQSWRLLIYGVLLLILMLFAPQGLMGLPFFKRWQKRNIVDVDIQFDSAISLKPVKNLDLTIKDLHKHFDGVKALQGCSLFVKAGRIHALIGPNGSGKTTTLNAISGFIRPDSGQVMIGTTDVSSLSPYQVAQHGVGRTFQTPKLLGDMSVLDNVRLGGFMNEHATAFEVVLNLPRVRSDDLASKVQALELLKFVGLSSRAEELAGELPHGQQRLVEIARALAGRPALLLLDEPAAGLSMSELDRLAELIEAISKHGTAVLIVEHHLDLIARISQSVTVFDRGQVLAEGSVKEVFKNPEVARAYMGREGTGDSM
jgi:branched-chain amino acid transport system permease protein